MDKRHAYSRGQIIPGRDMSGRDDVKASLTRGEAVLPVRTVDALGGPDAVAKLIEATNGKPPALGPKKNGKHARGMISGLDPYQQMLVGSQSTKIERKAYANQLAQDNAMTDQAIAKVNDGMGDDNDYAAYDRYLQAEGLSPGSGIERRYADGMVPEDERPRNLKEFYESQPPIIPYIKDGLAGAAGAAQNMIQGIRGQGDAQGITRALPLPVAAATNLLGVMRAGNGKAAAAQPVPALPSAPAPKNAGAAQAAGQLGLTPVSPGQLWNTQINQGTQAKAGIAPSRPTIASMVKPQAAPASKTGAQPVAAPVAAPVTQPAPQSPFAYSSLGPELPKSLGGGGYMAGMRGGEVVSGSDAKAIFNGMGNRNEPLTPVVVDRAGQSQTYRPFEDQYMTEPQIDAVTGARLQVGAPMTVGQAGAISKEAAQLQQEHMGNASDEKRTGMTIQGSMAETRLRESGTQGRYNSSMKAGETQNKLKEELAKLDLAILADPGNEGLRSKRSALTTKSALAEKDILDSYAKAAVMGGPAEGMSYQEYRSSITGQREPGSEQQPTPRAVYDKMKPGERYVGPDGVTYTKGK